MKFPTKHQYTFPKVETQIHPLLKLASHSLLVSEATSLLYDKTSKEICRFIADISRTYAGRSFADGEWSWLNDNCRVNILPHCIHTMSICC